MAASSVRAYGGVVWFVSGFPGPSLFPAAVFRPRCRLLFVWVPGWCLPCAFLSSPRSRTFKPMVSSPQEPTQVGSTQCGANGAKPDNTLPTAKPQPNQANLRTNAPCRREKDSRPEKQRSLRLYCLVCSCRAVKWVYVSCSVPLFISL